jgi:N-acetylglucosamine malate deacetylase 1
MINSGTDSDRCNDVWLVVSPHPDDLEIGMGGSVAKATAAGHQVISLVVTDGRRSPRTFVCTDAEMAAIRHQEVQMAATILGITQLVYLGLPTIQTAIASQILQTTFIKLCRQYRPCAIYLPHPYRDSHPTHRRVARICARTLSRHPELLTANLRVWSYEVWGLFNSWQHSEDITAVVDQKAAAINCHASQVQATNYTAGILGLNRWRGVFTDSTSLPGADYREAFVQLWPKSLAR